MQNIISNCIVIGGGRISLTHIPHLISHASVKLVAVIEPNYIMRLILRSIFKVKTYKSLSNVEKDQFDSVFILTPPVSHFEIARDLLDKGKHVFIEKPMTLDPKQSEQLLQLAKKRFVQFSCGYVYRHHPIFKEIKKIICDLNESSISCKINMRGNVVTADTPITWRNTGKGSGCLYDYGCHAIDMCIFFFGKPDSVECLSREELFQKGVIDRFSASFLYNDFRKIDCLINCDWADETVRKAGINVEIKTANNTIFTDGQTITLLGANSDVRSIKDLNTDVDYYLRGEEFQNQIDEFFSSVILSKFSYLGAESASLCDSIISNIYEAEL